MIKAPAWLQLLSRSAAALLGGYALSYAASACLARILPLSAADAVIVATLPAFIFY
ncbi:iron transporter, partial [Pseudomonas syringae]